MAEKSIEEKTRRIASQRVESGKEFQQMQAAQNQLMEIQAARQQNLRENKLESDSLAQQNQILAQAAQVGMMSQGAGQMRVNPATQNVMNRYGMARPMTTTTSKQSHSQVVTKQNVTIHNNTTNITNNVPANVGGPIQGRPVQFQQPTPQQQNNDGGMAKFKSWMNQTFNKQEENRQKREREYQRRELSLTKSANKMMRKLEDFSRDITKKLDPRNVGKNMGSQLKTILRLLGLGLLVKNFKKVLDWLAGAQDKVENEYIPNIKNFFSWVRGEEGSNKPSFITKMEETLKGLFVGRNFGGDPDLKKAFEEGGLLGGIGVAIKKSTREFFDKFRDKLAERWELARHIDKPDFSDRDTMISNAIDYIGKLISVLAGGEAAFNAIRGKEIEKRAEGDMKTTYLDSGAKYFDNGTGELGAPGKAGSGKGHYSSSTWKGEQYQDTSYGILAYNPGYGVHGYAEVDKDRRVEKFNGPNVKYSEVAPAALERNGKELATNFAPVIGENGQYKIDSATGEYITVEQTTLLGSISQMSSISQKWASAKQGQIDTAGMLIGLARMNGAIQRDGQVMVDWDDIKGIVGIEKAKELLSSGKVKLRKYYLIKRPKTLRELGAGKEIAEEAAMNHLAKAIVFKATGLNKVEIWGRAAVGAGAGAAAGSAFGGVGAGPGAIVGGTIGWASGWIDTNPSLVAIREACLANARNKNLDLYIFDLIPANVTNALELAKAQYGKETHIVYINGDTSYPAMYVLASLTTQVWQEILKTITGSADMSKVGYGMGNEEFESAVEAGMKNIVRKGTKIDTKNSNFITDKYGAGQTAEQVVAQYQEQRQRQRDLEEGRNTGYAGYEARTGTISLDGGTGPSTTSTGFVFNPEMYSYSSEGSTGIGPSNLVEQPELVQEAAKAESTSNSVEVIPANNTQPTTSSWQNYTSSLPTSYPIPVAPTPGQGVLLDRTNPTVTGSTSSAPMPSDPSTATEGWGATRGAKGAGGNSSLVNVFMGSPFYGSRSSKVTKITIHHMAGPLSIEDCGRIFQRVSPEPRNASSNYGVGSDGRVGMYVIEDCRAWTSSSSRNDNQAVTIEVANSAVGNPWPISDAAYQKLIILCADICWRRGIERLEYTGTPEGSLTIHSMFAATECPGPTLRQLITSHQLENDVNSLLANPSFQTCVRMGQTFNMPPGGSGMPSEYDGDAGKDPSARFRDLLDKAKTVVKDAIGGLVHEVPARVSATAARIGEGLEYDAAIHGGLANYDYGVRPRSSAEEAIYSRYMGSSGIPTVPTKIMGRNRKEWWAGMFDENGNLKSEETEGIPEELKTALTNIETELKKGNEMSELDLELAANSLDNAMQYNAGQTARDRRLINALTTGTPQSSSSITDIYDEGVQQ